MRAFFRDNALGLTFGGAFLLMLVGQSVAGLVDFNNQQVADGTDPVGYLSYVMSSSFAVDVAENWQSEYLQFLLYVFGTVWLFQRGSPESKPLHRLGRESDRDQQIGRHITEGSPTWAKAGGWRTAIFSRSLGLLMGVIFLLCWFAQSVAGWAAYNSEQLGQREDTTDWLGYLGSADFWNRSLQNWQSELLAVGSFAVLSVFLRQRGSPSRNPSARSTPPRPSAADQPDDHELDRKHPRIRPGRLVACEAERVAFGLGRVRIESFLIRRRLVGDKPRVRFLRGVADPGPARLGWQSICSATTCL